MQMIIGLTCCRAKSLSNIVSRCFKRSNISNLIAYTTDNVFKGQNWPQNICEDIISFCTQGLLKEALHILHIMDFRRIQLDSSAYASLLQCCVNMKALPEAKLVHAHIIQTGVIPDMFLETKIVIMYTKFGSLADAREVFDKMPERNVASWTALMSSHVKHGRGQEALVLFYQMRLSGIQPNHFTFASVLQACTHLEALEHGKEVHEDVVRSGFAFDIYVGGTLVNMYVKCNRLEDARKVFDEMHERNVVSWTAMIAGYAQNGHVGEALELFQRMPERNVVSWNAMIAGWMQNGYFDESLELFRSMNLTCFMPDSDTFASVLSACANLAALKHGKEVHGKIIRSRFHYNIFVGSALIDMYVKCATVDEARKVFDRMPEQNVVSWTALLAGYTQNRHVDEALWLFEKMPEKNVVSWTALIAGYAQNGHVDEALKLFQRMPVRNVISWNAMTVGCTKNGHFDEALKLFRQMQLTGVKPDSDTFASVLPACSNMAALECGKEIHGDIIRHGFQSDVFVGSALVDMYVKCRRIEDARKVFDELINQNVVSWTAMIAGYAQNGLVEEALNLFHKMPEQNVVTWTAIIAGCAKNENFDEALKLFRQMQLTAIKPDSDTFASVLVACANLEALQQGKEVHTDIIRNGFVFDVFVGSALVDMYSKCGSLEDACKVFDSMPEHNVVSWTAMIVGYAMHGSGSNALILFEQMQHSGMKPNAITFVAVLSACCHAGLVDDGWQYFNCMRQYYHIVPEMEHYCCMVDLLGRAGRLDEALGFINNMPTEPSAAVWRSFLGACHIHTNLELGKLAAEKLFDLDPGDSAHYVLLSNMYAAAGMWDEKEKVRKLMNDRRVIKMPGLSWIEVNNKVHTFLVGDRSACTLLNTNGELDGLPMHMEAGYEPCINLC